MGTSRLGNLLVEEGLLSEADRRTIRNAAGHDGAAFARGLLALGLLDETDLAAFLADRTHHRIAPKEIFREVEDSALSVLDSPLLERLEVLPLRLNGDVLTVAMADPLDRETIRQVEFFSGYKVRPVIATFSQIREGLKKILPKYEARTTTFEKFLENHATAAFRHLKNNSPHFDDPSEGRSDDSVSGSPKASSNDDNGHPEPSFSSPSSDPADLPSSDLDQDTIGDEAELEGDINLEDEDINLEAGNQDDSLLDENLSDNLDMNLESSIEEDPPAASADADSDDLGSLELTDSSGDVGLSAETSEPDLSDDLFGSDDSAPQAAEVSAAAPDLGAEANNDLGEFGEIADEATAAGGSEDFEANALEGLPDESSPSLDDLAPQDDSLENPDPLDDLSGLEPAPDLPLEVSASSSDAVENSDPLANLGSEEDASEKMIATIAAFNRCFVNVSMAADRATAAAKAAAFLSETGVARGMIAIIAAGQAKWSGTWDKAPSIKGLPSASAQQIKAITGQPWTRIKTGEWTALSDTLRSPDIDAAFKGWTPDGLSLQIFKTAGMGPGEELVFVAAWPAALSREPGILSAASELVRCIVSKKN